MHYTAQYLSQFSYSFLSSVLTWASEWPHRKSFRRPLTSCSICAGERPARTQELQWRQFQGQKVTAWCKEMKVEQRFTSVTYPKTNGQTEVTNRSIVQALKARLYGVGKDWVEELLSVLWAYRTTPRTSTGETPFSMVYSSEAVLPAEIREASAGSAVMMRRMKNVELMIWIW